MVCRFTDENWKTQIVKFKIGNRAQPRQGRPICRRNPRAPQTHHVPVRRITG